MKAIIKIIWLYGAVLLREYVMKFIVDVDETVLADKIYDTIPYLSRFNLETKLTDIFSNLNNIVFFTILFLGLDFINGQFSGVLKGPFKIISNTLIYLIGFSVLFFIINQFIMSHKPII